MFEPHSTSPRIRIQPIRLIKIRSHRRWTLSFVVVISRFCDCGDTYRLRPTFSTGPIVRSHPPTRLFCVKVPATCHYWPLVYRSSCRLFPYSVESPLCVIASLRVCVSIYSHYVYSSTTVVISLDPVSLCTESDLDSRLPTLYIVVSSREWS